MLIPGRSRCLGNSCKPFLLKVARWLNAFHQSRKELQVGAGTAVHGLDSRFQRVSLLVNKTTGEETHHMIKSAALLDSEPVMEKIVG